MGLSVEIPRLLFPEEALGTGEARIGGKATGLLRLERAGARVPPWFVVPAELFVAHLEGAGLLRGAEEELARLARLRDAGAERRGDRAAMAASLRSAIDSAPLDPELLNALAAGLERIGPGPFAVRSSAVGEDAALHSFAGQFDSFLFQRDLARVAESVRACWASAFTARALAYRLQAGGEPALPRMGVVVQRMIEGRVSGVLFTSDPVTGRRDQARLSACWGLGEGVVSGRCDADDFLCSAEGRELSATVARKEVQIVGNRPGSGTTEAPVPELRREIRCLDREEVERICREGFRLAAELGGPQDIEWTLADSDLYLLQARPITTLPAAPPPGGPRVVWDNSNIQESYCGVTTPLTFSFAVSAYASVYEQTMRAVGVPERVIATHRPMLRELLGLIGGRVYYNLNHWYRGLLLLPSFGRNKADMERMMGVEEPVDFVADETLSLSERLRRLPGLLALALRLQRRFRALPRAVRRFHADFERAASRVERDRLPTASLPELMETLEHLRTELLERWHTPIINDFFVMMSSGRLRRVVERAVGPEAAELLPPLLAGAEVESAEPTRMVLRMAGMARRDPALAAALRDGDSVRALARARNASPRFAALLDRFLGRYGDRCMGELKLETLSLRQDPSFLVRVLRNHMEGPERDEEALARRQRERREAVEAEVATRLGPLGRIRFRRALRAAWHGVAVRESMRLARTQMFGLFRDVYAAIGQRLHAAALLDHPRDVFYLSVEEIESYYRGTAVSADLAAVARARIAEYRKYLSWELPNRIETVGAVHLATLPTAAPPAAEGSGHILRGTGCSAGTAEAEARVVRSPDDDLSVAGRILVAERTDPGWGPLFPGAAGILVERGSTLSHSAVLARELGIPCVAGIPGLLRLVRNGERLRLDGAAGTVERIELR